MTDYEPAPGFRTVLTKLDLGEADVIVTPEADAAGWAERNGYRVTTGDVDGITVYEISSAEAGGTVTP